MYRFNIASAAFLIAATVGVSSAQAEVICNEGSSVTNIRKGPSARDYGIAGKLKNGRRITIVKRVTNADGYPYYKIYFTHPSTGKKTLGYVYHEAVKKYCGSAPKQAAAKGPLINRYKPKPLRFLREVSADEPIYSLCPKPNVGCGYIDEQGKWVLRPGLQKAYRFNKGHASVKLRGKWGLIDRKGHWIIAPELPRLASYSDGYFVIKHTLKKHWIIADKSGNVTAQIPLSKIDSIYPFSGGVAAASSKLHKSAANKPLFGFINPKGRWVIQPNYLSGGYLKSGLTAVKSRNKKYGLINKRGKWVMKPTYHYLGTPNKEGIMSAAIASKSRGLLDLRGNWVSQPRFESHYHFKEGLAAVQQKGKWGYIDQDGNMVIRPRFDFAGSFLKGAAVVRVGKKYGSIDHQGKWLLEPIYENSAYYRADGLTIAKKGGKTGLIDPSGFWVVEPKYKSIYTYGNLYKAKFGDREGYLDSDGQPLTFSSEDYMMAMLDANKAEMERKLAAKDKELKRLRKEAADAKAKAQRATSRANSRPAPARRSTACDHVYIGKQFKSRGGVLGLKQYYIVVGFSSRSQQVTIRSKNSSYRQQISCRDVPY